MWASVLRTQEESEVLPAAKTNLLRKEQKEHLEEEVGKTKKGTGAGMMWYRVFQDRVFAYSSRQMTVLIDRYKLCNSSLY